MGNHLHIAGTRLMLDTLYPPDSTEPTRPTEPIRTTPPPVVSPPGRYTPRSDAVATGATWRAHEERRLADTPVPTPSPGPATWGAGRRGHDRAGPPRTLREVAAERAVQQELAEIRHLRHQRHMDAVEAVRAWLGVLCLVGLALFVLGAAALAFAILAGWWTWMPAPH